MMNLSRFGKVTRVVNYLSADTDTTDNGAHVDMQGYKSVVFYCLLGSVVDSPANGSVVFKVQQASAITSPEAFADLEDTAVTFPVTGDSKVAILEIDSPKERYVRPVIVRTGGDSSVDGVIAVQTGSYKEPITHDVSTVLSSEYHLSPAEGTA